jgi:ribosome-binding protein aMBF1 (putative translation factor)
VDDASHAETMRVAVRAARQLLGWEQADLIRASGLGEATIKSFEAGRAVPKPATLSRIRRTLERHGVFVVIEADGGIALLRHPARMA